MNKKRKNNYFKGNKGITLIALIVTIIVLIILAGVSINLILGENGIIRKAQEAKEAQTEAEVREKVTMLLAEYAMEREFNNKTLLEFLQEKKDNQEIDGVTDNGDGILIVELNGYAVVIDINKLSIISIDKNGKTTNINLSDTTAKLNEIITATVSFGEEIDYAKCKWKYSTDLQLGTDEASYTNAFASSENTIELTTTEQGIYYLHILVVDKEGNKTEKVSSPIKVGNYVTSIILDKTEATIEEGDTLTIVATVGPDDATNKEIEWISSDETIATVDETGKITAVKAGKVTITAIAKDGSGIKTTCSIEVTGKQPVDVSTIQKGIFIEYDVEYTDTYYSSYKYTSTNGWRLLNYKTRDDGKTLYDVELISTGIPARMYYYSSSKTNNYSKWITDETKLNEFKKILGSEYNYYTGDYTYNALQASAGFYYNLGEMAFKQGTSYSTKNMGYYTAVKNGETSYTTGSTLGNNLFKTSKASNVRMLTLPELNTALGITDIDSVLITITDTTGLFQLSQLKSVLSEKKYSKEGDYWLASPFSGKNDAVCFFYAQPSAVSNGDFNYYGVRPVVSLSSDIQLTQEINEDGLTYYKIK